MRHSKLRPLIDHLVCAGEDEAWQRAERFVSEEVCDRLLESRSQQ
jgi:hypothetical protein